MSDDDLGEIVEAFKAKAKAGHEGAARFLFDHILGAKYTPTQITVNNFHGDGVAPERVVIGEDAVEATPLARVSIYLSATDRATPRAIAADTGLPETDVVRVLDDHPDRFNVFGSKYSLAR